MTAPERVFVYGTLASGGAQAALLGPGRRVPARVRGALYELPAGYPALVLAGDALVHGELVEVEDPRRLALADRYEGVDEGLYQRVRVDVWVGLRAEPAWAWVMAPERAREGRLLPSGRWRPVRVR